jgi:hypothetical protein
MASLNQRYYIREFKIASILYFAIVTRYPV